jgi:hypothetical protein
MKWIGGNMKRGRNRKRNNTGQGWLKIMQFIA